MKRNFKAMIIATLMVLTLSTTSAFATSPYVVPDYYESDAFIMIEGEHFETSTAPIVENYNTLVPMREVCEKLGYTVDWDQELQVATVYYIDELGTIVMFKIYPDEDTIQVGFSYTGLYNEEITGIRDLPLPNPVRIINGVTMVPIRYFAEVLGYEVIWDSFFNAIWIDFPEDSYYEDTYIDEEEYEPQYDENGIQIFG